MFKENIKRLTSDDYQAEKLDFASAVLLTRNLKKSPWLLSRCKKPLGHVELLQMWMRKSENLKVIVKLNSTTSTSRYLLVLSETKSQNANESIILLGVDVTEKNEVTIGLILPVTKEMDIWLNGDGGFCITYAGKKYNLEPVSVQEMWTAVQALVKAILSAKNKVSKEILITEGTDRQESNNEYNEPDDKNASNDSYENSFDNNREEELKNNRVYISFDGGDHVEDKYSVNNIIGSSDNNYDNDLDYYNNQVKSCATDLYHWQKVNDEYASAENNERISLAVGERVSELKVKIRRKLQEILMNADPDNLTSLQVRTKLEESLGGNLKESMGMSRTQYKQYIDEDMIIVMKQMDSPSKIDEHLYLGSEWNASNLDELRRNGIGYILNVTREIDNFFPGMFRYCNVRLYDHEDAELISHWNNTYKFIDEARDNNVNVLVHCKMGVSRSASTVMAYLMKEKQYTVEEAFQAVKSKRSCVQPNPGFMNQLITYQGILDASNQRYCTHFKSRSIDDLTKPSQYCLNTSSSFKSGKVKKRVNQYEKMESNKHNSKVVKMKHQSLPSTSSVQKSVSLPFGEDDDNIAKDVKNEKVRERVQIIDEKNVFKGSNRENNLDFSDSISTETRNEKLLMGKKHSSGTNTCDKFVIVDVDKSCLNVAQNTINRGSFDRSNDDDYGEMDDSELSISSVLRQWSFNCVNNPHFEADVKKSNLNHSYSSNIAEDTNIKKIEMNIEDESMVLKPILKKCCSLPSLIETADKEDFEQENRNIKTKIDDFKLKLSKNNSNCKKESITKSRRKRKMKKFHSVVVE